MVRRGLWLLSACLIFITVVSDVAYAQQYIKFEACKPCRGTGKNLCPRCGGRGCSECSFSGVLDRNESVRELFLSKDMLPMVERDFSCHICKGAGKVKVDTRFIGCTNLGDGGYNGYQCPDSHPIGKVVIVDDYDKGNILKKYTKAEWQKKAADDEAQIKRQKQEEELARQEAERAKQEAERVRQEAERVKQEAYMARREEAERRRIEATVLNALEEYFVPVKGGTFNMGGPGAKPVHSVTVSDFSIGKYEVTEKLWRLVMGELPRSRYDRKWNSRGDDYPVANITFDEVMTFINYLNALLHTNAYRLPTEAEWEYAARGGANSKGYKYSGGRSIGKVGWYYGGDKKWIQPVGRKLPNELGIFDMSGNVWEFVSDWYGEYGSNAQVNPKGPASGPFRVLRGGSCWNNDDKYFWVFNRVYDAGIASPPAVGFRFVKGDAHTTLSQSQPTQSARGGGDAPETPSQPQPTTQPTDGESGAMTGGRSRASIQRTAMQNMAMLLYAYNKRLIVKPGLSGKITVTYDIDEHGNVISARVSESTIGDSELENTVVDRVKSWKFDKIDKPGDVTTVTYPFVFSQ